MTKKLIALLLCVLTIVSVLTVSAAAYVPTLTDMIEMSQAYGLKTLTLPYNLTISDETIIPKGFTVYVPENVVLSIENTLIVRGMLYVKGLITPGSNKNIQLEGNGSWSYSQLTPTGSSNPAGLSTYSWQYAYAYYLANGFFPTWFNAANYTTIGTCNIHSKCPLNYCSTCKTWHCSKCGHIGGHGTGSTLYFCVSHKKAMSYCSACGKYICPDCNPGHSHTGIPVIPTSNRVCNYHGNNYRTYCSVCNVYYCAMCNPHSHYSAPSGYPYYPGYPSYPSYPTYYGVCPYHKQTYDYCSTCQTYYCPTCSGSAHNHSVAVVGNYLYIPGVGYIYVPLTSIDEPTASVPSSTQVKPGIKVTLSCGTPDAVIYYTTNGSAPDASGIKYTGPITVDRDMTIRAIAIKNNNKSTAATFKYTVIKNASFVDTSKFDGLDSALSVLVSAGILANAKEFRPEDTFTYAELVALLSEFGIDMAKTEVDAGVFEKKAALTYDDFYYITYRALRAYNLIKTPRTVGMDTIKKFSHYKEITDASIYRAAYISFYENGLVYDTNITPANNARRVDLAIALAAVVANN